MSTERVRVPFGLTDGDVKAHVTPRIGERFTVNVDIADGVAAQLAAECVHRAMRVAAEQVAREQQGRIESIVADLLMTKEWVMGVIEQEVRAVAVQWIAGMFQYELEQKMRTDGTLDAEAQARVMDAFRLDRRVDGK